MVLEMIRRGEAGRVEQISVAAKSLKTKGQGTVQVGNSWGSQTGGQEAK
jgi:hypothetical protein